MAVDRKLFSQPIRMHAAPSWPCGRCKTGVLRLGKDSLKAFESADAEATHAEYGYHPDNSSYRFVAILICSNAACADTTVASGTGYEEHDWNEEEGETYESLYNPRSVLPAPHLFTPPRTCPPQVCSTLNEAFELFWVDYASSLNRLRIAIEQLLDHARIRRFGSAKGKRKRLSLHDRIELYQAKRPELVDLLKAAKWLGNEGSHNSAVAREDVFDACDIIELILQELFVPKRHPATKIAKEINKRKGSRHRKRKRADKDDWFIDILGLEVDDKG